MSSTINISSNSTTRSLQAFKLGFLSTSTSGGQYQPAGARARSDTLDATEPDYKRPRLVDYSTEKVCLRQQIFPIVTRIFARHDDVDLSRLDTIRKQLVAELIADPIFKYELAEGNGRIGGDFERRWAKQAELKVATLLKQQRPSVSTPKENLIPTTPLAVVQSNARPQQPLAITARPKPPGRALSSSSIPLPNVPVPAVPKRATARPVPPKTATKPRSHASSIRRTNPPTSGPEIQRPAVPLQVGSGWFEKKRPYLSTDERAELIREARQSVVKYTDLSMRTVLHVDFTREERTALLDSAKVQTEEELRGLLKKKPSSAMIATIADIVEKTKAALPFRTPADIHKFLQEFRVQKTSSNPPEAVAMRQDVDNDVEAAQQEDICSLLLMRETTGYRGLSGARCHRSFVAACTKLHEDGLELRERWNGCAGDIATIIWVSNNVFVCGTTEHSDAHNQQYNKPGNLVLGICDSDKGTATLKSFPDHRIIRPRVMTGENARVGMRESQSPWLYTSVVSSDHDAVHGRTYTAGFDHTVKIWSVESPQMKLLGEWVHEGNVNFVAASKHASGMVATGADVPSSAIRVYDFQDVDVSQSSYRSFSCSKTDENGNVIATDNKWAYFPATMQWGLAPGVQSFLLVGYSPRSLTDDENDIPPDMLDTGELCVWNMLSGEKWEVSSVTHKNIFEVLWHPTHNSFIAATSPKGLPTEKRSVKTQIRIFQLMQNPTGDGAAFCKIKVLDCNAVDINELTIKPNSHNFSYITAGCTDGNVYVWDSGLPQDGPIHVLRHGKPIDEYRGDREKEDTGVKFTAWGKSLHRFYTGSSDGVVKVWDVQARPAVLVRNLLECPAPVSYGMFSPNMSKLVIGDATGRVSLFSLGEEDHDDEKPPLKLSAQYSKPIQQHADPPPPPGMEIPALPGIMAATEYLRSGQLELHKNPTVGAVQGPQYAQAGLFCHHAHREGDPELPLMAYEQKLQQDQEKIHSDRWKRRTLRTVQVTPQTKRQHVRNVRSEVHLPVVPTGRAVAGHDFDVCASNAADFSFAYESDDFFSFGMD